jgi:hypothetical protein
LEFLSIAGWIVAGCGVLVFVVGLVMMNQRGNSEHPVAEDKRVTED